MSDSHSKPLILAEVKTHSPFGWKSEKTWDALFTLAERVGDMISIHTDARWGGSMDLIKKARSMTDKPLLAKGIHADDALISQALDAGADWVLVVGRIPAIHAERCLIEPNTIEELRAIPPSLRAVWNSRDLSTGGMKKETFEEARKVFSGWLCQASNLKTCADIKEGADAVLVGTNLEAFASSL